MRKPLVIAAMMLCCSLVHAQEADELGSGAAELSIIARAEYLNTDPLGNTSLYTLLEGNISQNLSYSVANHWLSSEPGSLYSNTLRSDDVNWLDWAYLTYSFDSIELSLGKDMLVWGTYEMDEYDFDIHYPFASSVWSCLPIYQWGLKASWLPMDELTFDARVSSSPFGEHPFSSGLFAYGARARFEVDESYGGMVACNLLETEKGVYSETISAGLQAYVGENRIVADFNSVCGDWEEIFADGFGVSLTAICPVNDEIEIMTKASYEQFKAGLVDRNAGVAVHYMPLDGLRVHALSGYRFGNIDNGLYFSLGVTYNFSLSL